MSLEDRLFERRYQKIREIEALGFATYPRKFDYTHTAGEIRTNYGTVERRGPRGKGCPSARLRPPDDSAATG